MKKNILIIGNDANAYALAKNLSEKHELFVTPSSDAIKEFATIVDIREDNPMELLEFVASNNIDMTVPISRKSIESDIASIFTQNNQPIFAPSAKASELVSNKALAKKVLYKLRIPTPKFGIFEKESMALDYIKNQPVPFVIKTNDSNSAVVLTSQQSAKIIINSISIERNKKIIVEDYIYGTPFAFYAITDGYKALPLGSSLNYKHALEGEGGQLTGGMGACVPNYKLSINDEYFLMDNVIYPTLSYLENGGNTYLGILGVNGIKTDEGKIYILGWNSFMQNSDAAAILDYINEDIYTLFESCIVGSFSDEIDTIKQKDLFYTSLVLNCKSNDKENIIKGFDTLDECTFVSYFPTVQKNKYLEYEANYGANLCLTTFAPTISSAEKKLYEEAECIDFKGIKFRKDIAGSLYTA